MFSCAICTLGCKVNQCESESIASQLKEQGYEIVDFSQKADVYVINTCCVTAEGERKSRQMVRRALSKNKNAIIAVTGCAAQRTPQTFKQIEGVKIVAGNSKKGELASLIKENLDAIKVEDLARFDKYIELDDFIAEKTRAFVKIQDGCNNFCSYCIIPYVRGRECSRRLENVVKQVKKLAENGFKEIVLTGIHLSSYGKEFNLSLADVVEAVCDIDKIKRVRLGSLEQSVITDEFLMRLKKQEKFCPQFHLSLQSGSDTVLKRMNRKYTADEFLTATKKIKKVFPLAAITTDVITGFWGETEDEFLQTKEFLKKVSFAQTHVFPYSEREGTVAAKQKDQVDKAVRAQRANELIVLCKELTDKYLSKFIGKQIEVLLETQQQDVADGISREHIRVYVKEKQAPLNEIINVKVKGLFKDGVLGERV